MLLSMPRENPEDPFNLRRELGRTPPGYRAPLWLEEAVRRCQRYFRDPRLNPETPTDPAIAFRLCWQWTGTVTSGQRPLIWFKKRRYLAAQLVYQHLVGPIPDGTVVRAVCGNPRCVTPYHLYCQEPRAHMLPSDVHATILARWEYKLDASFIAASLGLHIRTVYRVLRIARVALEPHHEAAIDREDALRRGMQAAQDESDMDELLATDRHPDY